MTTLTQEKLNALVKGNITKADVVGVINTLASEAKAGDAQAMKMLHAVDFQQQLSQAFVGATKEALRTLGCPITPDACVAAAFANALEVIGLEVTPSIHKEFDEVRADLAASPQVMADRAKAQSNFEARVEFSARCKAEGMSRDEIKHRVGELYNAQLRDFIVSNDAEEALAN